LLFACEITTGPLLLSRLPQNLKLKQSSKVSCLTCQPLSINPLYLSMDT
jgi:hypothetical protein